MLANFRRIIRKACGGYSGSINITTGNIDVFQNSYFLSQKSESCNQEDLSKAYDVDEMVPRSFNSVVRQKCGVLGFRIVDERRVDEWWRLMKITDENFPESHLMTISSSKEEKQRIKNAITRVAKH